MNKVLCTKIGKNSICQMVSERQTLLGVDTVVDSWQNSVYLTPSAPDQSGLRPPQCGALFAIKAHWTVSEEPATIVIPSGALL